MTRVVLVVLLAIILIPLAGIYVFFHGLSGNGCTTTLVSETVSPDRMWKAEVDESFCQSPFLTDITDEVRLVSMGDSSRTGDILNVNTGGNASERPRIAWIAPSRLRAIVPFPAEMKVGESAFEGIHVDTRDPSARAAWLRELDAMTHGK